MRNRGIGPIGLLVWCALTGVAGGEEKGDLGSALEQRLALKQTDPQAWRKVMDAGQQKVFLCAYCHGEDGNSVQPFVPNLAGQNARYLLDQLQQYSDGRRKHFVMTPMIKEFSDEEILDSVVYYANRRPRPGNADRALADQGRNLYQQHCESCHRADGRGNEKFARLASQNAKYLEQRLTGMRRTGAPGSVMSAIAAGLKDEQIAALAAHLTSLP
jgi:cytochrome c553